MSPPRMLPSLFALAALSACGSSIPDPVSIQQRISLTAFESCEELERYIQDTAVLDMRTRLTQAKDEPNHWFGGGWAEDTVMRGGAPEAASEGPSAYTTTNTQVAGVDEADFVKNDGRRIFVLAGEYLYVNVSWPAEDLATVSRIHIEGRPQELFLDESDRVVVFSSVHLDTSSGEPMPNGMACIDWECGYGPSATKVTVIDVSDLANPREIRADYLPGQYARSRRIGNSVRLVINDSFRWPKDVRFYPDYRDNLYEDRGRLAAEYDRLIGENEKVIRATPLSEWLPPSMRRVGDVEEEVGYSCTDFHHPTGPTELGYLTVATLDLEDVDAPIARTTVVANAREVYASHEALYVASRHWWWWPRPGQRDHTYVHKFSLNDPTRAAYLASGGVDGHLLNQFSMDEHDGHFRVATTVTERNAGWTRINRVTVLKENAGRLEEVGRTPDLAEDERIYSVRFMGDRAFVVTFLEMDPLFAIDLSDPTRPVVRGELKIPGFSTYLHPIDENHLLAIGVHVPEPDSQGNVAWGERALKLSLFDVSDMTAPREKFTREVGTFSSSSEALHDHRAFNWFPERQLLAIPFWDWGHAHHRFRSELKVFHVDVETGIAPRGEVGVADMYRDRYDWRWYWSPAVRRSVMADDYVYAISDAGIRVARIESLGTPVETVLFDEN